MSHPVIDQQVTFLYTRDLKTTSSFYEEVLGLSLVLDQGSCRIYRISVDGFLGFCQREEAETCGIITFVYPDRAGVDRMYDQFQETALDPPRDNPRYPIYNFFSRDPEGRLIEFQVFTGDVDWSFYAESGARTDT